MPRFATAFEKLQKVIRRFDDIVQMRKPIIRRHKERYRLLFATRYGGGVHWETVVGIV
jgi:hypothetical protein